MLERLGRIPEEGDGFAIPGAEIRVERVERHRIAGIRLTPVEPPPPPSGDGE